METFVYVCSFSSIFFLLSEALFALETHLLYKENPCNNRFLLSLVSGAYFLFLMLSFLFSIPYHAIHDVLSHYKWKRVSKMIKTAYKIGVTDCYYLHKTDFERKVYASWYYEHENHTYDESSDYSPEKRDELDYWSWKQDTLRDAEMSENDLYRMY